MRSASGLAITSSRALASRGALAPSEQLKVGDGQEIQRDFQISVSIVRCDSSGALSVRKQPDGPPIAGAIVVAEPIGARIPPTHGFADALGHFELHRPFEAALVYARDPVGNLAGYSGGRRGR